MMKRLYIHTIGCQMNVYDSEQIHHRLQPLGYRHVKTPVGADLIIVNTCAIREKAEQKVFSFLGRLPPLKLKNPGLIIGVGGCVAQQEGKKIIQRMPCVDFVFGTNAIARLPGIVERVVSKKCRVVDINMMASIAEPKMTIKAQPSTKTARFVTIMRGCDNYCTYCVVPHVRGREISRKPEDILKEIERLIESGAREVTLLGQNVNSYGMKEGLYAFPELLERVNAIEGLRRIRFTTSHPKDLSGDLMTAFRDLKKLCHHIHLPVQSGSDSVLKRMNRKYTRQRYLEKVEALRRTCPEIAITSDFIVGFPGETRSDFDKTLDLIHHVEYDGAFAFKYSDRPNAPAARFGQKISESEKNDRLQELLEIQEHYTRLKNTELIGSMQWLLVDGLSKEAVAKQAKPEEIIANGVKNGIEWTGRTSTNKIVNFAYENTPSPEETICPGEWVKVRIEKAFAHSLWGRPVADRPGTIASKGEQSYAA